MINRERLIETFCKIVSIDSPSGEEKEISKVFHDILEKLNFNVKEDSYGNLIANDGKKNPFMLSAHMDTVEPGRGIKPIIKNNQIRSDGTTIVGGDCKAGIAAMIEALHSIQEDGTNRIATEIVLTREEEVALLGARNLDFSMISAKEGVILDGEGPCSRITSASPSYVSFDITITGRAAHAGVEPEIALSSIYIAADLIQKLPQGRLDKETTFNIGMIDGGSTRNTVPHITNIKGEFRSINIETIDLLKTQCLNTINEVQKLYPEAEIEHTLTDDFHTYTLPPNNPSTEKIKKALTQIGLQPTMDPSGGGTDGNVFRLNGIDTTVIGIACRNFHRVDEYVIISELVDLAHFCETLLKDK